MAIIDSSYIHKLFRISLVLFCIFSASFSQQLILQEFNQPPAGPDFGQNDIAREMLIADSIKIKNQLIILEDDLTDALIDPDGRIAEHARNRHRRKQVAQKEEELFIEYLNRRESQETKKTVKWSTILMTLIGCLCIVACGVIPAFILPAESDVFHQTPEGRKKLNLLLSFAVGSLLGDVFLHILPEVWSNPQANQTDVGIWILFGLLLCFIIEKCCSTTEDSQKKVCAIVNLVANFTDNFTHGLAIGGSFLISSKLGYLTTFAITIHELPHEISDFAILLRANFGRWSAIKAQLWTAVAGIIGAFVALFLQMGSSSVISQQILPFTAGGFLNIALAQILPELINEKNPKQNILQLLSMFAGIIIMGILGQFSA